MLLAGRAQAINENRIYGVRDAGYETLGRSRGHFFVLEQRTVQTYVPKTEDLLELKDFRLNRLREQVLNGLRYPDNKGFDILKFLAPQQNLWVTGGSGSCPSL